MTNWFTTLNLLYNLFLFISKRRYATETGSRTLWIVTIIFHEATLCFSIMVLVSYWLLLTPEDRFTIDEIDYARSLGVHLFIPVFILLDGFLG